LNGKQETASFLGGKLGRNDQFVDVEIANNKT
jgi:hypothetical protein